MDRGQEPSADRGVCPVYLGSGCCRKRKTWNLPREGGAHLVEAVVVRTHRKGPSCPMWGGRLNRKGRVASPPQRDRVPFCPCHARDVGDPGAHVLKSSAPQGHGDVLINSHGNPVTPWRTLPWAVHGEGESPGTLMLCKDLSWSPSNVPRLCRSHPVGEGGAGGPEGLVRGASQGLAGASPFPWLSLQPRPPGSPPGRGRGPSEPVCFLSGGPQA